MRVRYSCERGIDPKLIRRNDNLLEIEMKKEGGAVQTVRGCFPNGPIGEADSGGLSREKAELLVKFMRKEYV